jgi:hypothetical protein
MAGRVSLSGLSGQRCVSNWSVVNGCAGNIRGVGDPPCCRDGDFSFGGGGILDMNIGLFISFLNKIIPRNNTECFIGIFSI